jgi:hypothetical protein
MISKISTEKLIDLSVYHTVLPDIDNEFLSNSILSNLKTPEVPGYLDKHNHTYYEDTILVDSSQLRYLIGQICSVSSSILNREYVMESIWGLVLNDGQSVAMHSHKSNGHLHPLEYYSIAYYPMVPEGSAGLIFSINYCNTIEEVRKIEPQQGMLILFNSFIAHMTSVHNSSTPRIVISANLAPKNPNDKIVPDWSPYQIRKNNEEHNNILL